ncbi:MAG: Hint domain-containing protein [Marinibacterium sp.]|nr:Hint domain-containing protein [Marinibacterium sp.]
MTTSIEGPKNGDATVSVDATGATSASEIGITASEGVEYTAGEQIEKIKLREGDDTLTITGANQDSTKILESVKTDNGNDTITITDSIIEGNVNSNGDDDIIYVEGSTLLDGLSGGNENDQITIVSSTVEHIIDGDSDDDFVTITSDSSIQSTDGGARKLKGSEGYDTLGVAGTFTLVMNPLGSGDTYTVTHVGNDMSDGYVVDGPDGTQTLNYDDFKTLAESDSRYLEDFYLYLEDGHRINGTAFEAWGFTTAFCFGEGTLIDTPTGPRRVETLGIGDLVLTKGGQSVPVRWLGKQTVMAAFGPAERLLPVRIAAGALGPQMPHTDLIVTADHGMLVDGVICHAGALVNGSTITRVPLNEMGPVYTVYHIDTAEHEIILANGAPAETFIDNAGRNAFDNVAEFDALYGDVPEMEELPFPRAMSARQLPKRIKDLIAARQAA